MFVHHFADEPHNEYSDTKDYDDMNGVRLSKMKFYQLYKRRYFLHWNGTSGKEPSREGGGETITQAVYSFTIQLQPFKPFT